MNIALSNPNIAAAMAKQHMLDAVAAAHPQCAEIAGYVIGCVDGPGLDAVRFVHEAPVVGTCSGYGRSSDVAEKPDRAGPEKQQTRNVCAAAYQSLCWQCAKLRRLTRTS